MVSVLETLSHWSLIQPDKQAWVFLNDKGDPTDSYTYQVISVSHSNTDANLTDVLCCQELDAASSHLSDYLQSTHKLRGGDRVLLVFFPGLDFTLSLLACFKAGLIAVPVFPPDPRKMKKDLHHFVNIQLSCSASTVLTNSLYNFTKKIEGLRSIFSTEHTRWPDLKWIVVDDVLKKGKSASKTKTSSSIAPSIIATPDLSLIHI